MIVSRSSCFAFLLCLLAACGGDREAPDTAPGAQASDTAAARGDSATDAPASAGSPIPAFVNDTPAAAEDTTNGIRSVYTSLGEADCRLVKEEEETGGTTSRCPGTAGYALLVHDYDARMSVDIVAPGGRTHELRYWGVITANFSSLGPRAEWRMRGGTPVALIVRVNAFENPEKPDAATSYLAVAKIAGGETCVIDRIAPSANANEAARTAADQSASRPCLRDLGDQPEAR
ncbi:hypothetical protein [Longimicrobium sp.]|uniref:hypothetical protein n=1 Tax=Longimicrobium sp. TaxID=2029185 RepID=UPI002E342F55|nr:hypothetical protein [Longimicrobium sp.]HEX6041916.1 hypothetical protein [Longimicrobium sp.]